MSCGWCLEYCFWIDPPPGEEMSVYVCSGGCEELGHQGEGVKCRNKDNGEGCTTGLRCVIYLV